MAYYNEVMAECEKSTEKCASLTVAVRPSPVVLACLQLATDHAKRDASYLSLYVCACVCLCV